MAPEQPNPTGQPEAQWPWGSAALGEPLGPGQPALSADQILEAINQGEIKALILVENDPFWLFYDEERLAWALDKLELVVVLDYVPSPTVTRAQVLLPTLSLFERTGSSFVNQEGRVQAAPPVHCGGTPIALISPDVHPPRTFLCEAPGSDPRSPAEIFQELIQAVSKLKTPGPLDLWTWLARQNPMFSRMSSLPEHPEGIRLLPAANSERDFAAPFQPAAAMPPDTVELLLVDWTFGTEELAGYSDILREAETTPALCMHPREAEKSGLADGQQVALHLPNGSLTVAVKLSAAMARGVMVLPRHRQLNWRKLLRTPVYFTSQHLDKVQG
jgi:anaerobic selenocysteine-containing dehydrogenase